MNSIPKHVNPASTLVVQPDAPHMSAIDLGLAHTVQGLWYRCRGTRHSWVWPDPESAPQCNIVAINTWTVLQFDLSGTATSLALPWYSQKESDEIRGVISWGWSDATKIVSTRIRSRALCDAVANADGTPTNSTGIAGSAPPPRGAMQQIGMRTFATARVSVRPNFPANRRIGITVDAKYTVIADEGNVSATVPVYLYSLALWDVFPDPVT